MLNLEPIKARLAAATPGLSHPFRDWPLKPDDAALIANAATDLTALVEEVERLRVRLEQLEATEALERAIWRKCILDDEDRVNGLHKEATKNLDLMPGKPIDWSRYNAES